ncbi:flagellar hook-length control protein FliK [Gemmobacter lanyuensis]
MDTARSDWTQAVAGHVIAKVEEGGLELDLAPEHLGRLRVRVEMVDGAARVTFVTETAEAARLLQEAQESWATACRNPA